MKSAFAKDVDVRVSKRYREHTYNISFKFLMRTYFYKSNEDLDSLVNYFRLFGYIIRNEIELRKNLKNLNLITYENSFLKGKQ